MAATLSRFAINAADVPRARQFYADIFGWSFMPMGPPGVHQITNAGMGGGVQGRYAIAADAEIPGLELTFGVDDLPAVMAAIKAGGGKVLTQPYRIEGVGEVIFFQDTEGNLGKVMRYDAGWTSAVSTASPRAARLRHFAINATDVPRARRFYEGAFGWVFEPWGPPGFYQVRNAGEHLLGALQGRREIEAGTPMPGYEASFGVEDLKAVIAAVRTGGGRLLMRPYRIEGVGELIFLADPDGTIMGAMQYDPGVFD